MGRIVAIGGGDFNNLKTFEIDKYIVKSTNKEKPRVLFIPTASNEAPLYIEMFNKIYGEMLGCNTDILYLLNNNISDDEIKEKIFTSDIVYVGGGNTKNMLKVWKESKVDYYLREAFKKDIILCGLSAGSICWFEHGFSDSSSKGDEFDNYTKLEALGLLKGIHCPHFDENGRKDAFIEMLKGSNILGIGLDNKCALEILDDKFKIIKSDKEAKAYKLFNKNDVVIKKELNNTETYDSLEKLYKVF